MSYSDRKRSHCLTVLYKALTVDKPMIRLILAKVEHIQPLQLTPPVSLEYLEEKLEAIYSAIMQLIESIDSLADDVYPRFCIPPKSSMPEVHRDVYRYSCSKAMDFSEDDKMEWADSIKLWNEGMLSVVKKTDDMIETAQLVADVLGNWAGRWSWD